MAKNSQKLQTGGERRYPGPDSRRSSQKPAINRQFSSGGVVFKKEKDGSILWFVRATNPSKLFPKLYWTLPRGWIDNDGPDTPGPMASGRVKADEESLRVNALREVREEGGIKAKIITKIETSRIFFTHPKTGKILKFITFYLMEWQEDLSEGFDDETSEILWTTFENAYKKLSFGGEKQTLKKAKALLDQGIQSSLV